MRGKLTDSAERRTLSTEFEVRSDGGRKVVVGYALKWGQRSQNLGGFVERVAQGATSKTIAESDIRALLNHDGNLILGRNKSGTLALSEDSTGLEYVIDPPDTSYARDLMVSMERGDITQSSFQFRTIDDEWGFTDDDFPLRTLREIQLLDVSPVTYPAYLDTNSGVGSRALARLQTESGLEIVADDIESIRRAVRKESAPVETATPIAYRNFVKHYLEQGR